MNRLTPGKPQGCIAQFYLLFNFAHQVHFNPVFFLIIKSMVFKTIGFKICVHQSIDIAQYIQIKKRSNTLLVIVRRLQYPGCLMNIDTYQNTTVPVLPVS